MTEQLVHTTNWDSPQVVTWERLVLPLAGAAETVAMLLVGAYPLADLHPST